MNSTRHDVVFSILAMLLFCVAIPAAATTGKISGTVRDKQTGEPLAGANVVLPGTHLGAATAPDGYFYIIGVPPGKYEVKVLYIGYHTLTITDVFIRVGLTTKLEVKLDPEALEGSQVTIVAEREIIQKDVTSTRRVVTSEDIGLTPGMESVSDVLGLMPGVTLDSRPLRLTLGDGSQLQVRDESLKNVHIRGGRGGEILYMVDGMPVTHPIYGGRDVLDLNVEDVDQIELLTGGFGAEYGQAQSGVVNISTRSGHDQFQTGIEYKRDVIGDLGRSQNREYASLNLGGRLQPFSRESLLGKIFYFASANVSLADGPFNNGRQRDEFTAFDLREKQDNTSNLNAKVTWKFADNARFDLSYHGSWKQWSNLNWGFQDFPNNAAEWTRNTQTLNLRYNHVLSKSTFFTVNLGYLGVKFNGSLDGKSTPADFWTINDDTLFTRAIPPQTDPATGFFNDVGVQATWRDDRTRTYTFKTELTSQIHRDHLIKTGASVQYHDLQYIDIQDGAFKLSNFGEWKFNGGDFFDPAPGPFPEFGQTRWAFETRPLFGDFYIQDKYELESLIFNVGARLDWVYLGNQINDPAYKARWQSATGLEPDWNLWKTSISPRFGISFPISDIMVLIFSYGHFSQLPEMQHYYRDPWSGTLTGNPHLTFEKTILYEFGLTRKLSDDWSIDLKGYGKDIADFVGTEKLRSAAGLPVTLHINQGYGRARGLEMTLNKAFSGLTTLNLGYTLQWATGYSSSAFSDFIRDQENIGRPIRERPLDWDIRQQVILNASLISLPGKHMNLFGLKMPDNWHITLLTRFSSGEPYSPGTVDPLEARVRENGETQPYQISTDLKINKSFSIGFGTFSVFLDFFSIFNRRNDVDVNLWTGEAIKYGDLVPGTEEIYNWRQMNAIMTPRWWTPPRYAQLGVRFTY